MFSCIRENRVELFVLLFDAMDVLMHGNFLGKDNEESPFCGGEDIRLKQAPLPPALHSFSSTPTICVAWQHQPELVILSEMPYCCS